MPKEKSNTSSSGEGIGPSAQAVSPRAARESDSESDGEENSTLKDCSPAQAVVQRDVSPRGAGVHPDHLPPKPHAAARGLAQLSPSSQKRWRKQVFDVSSDSENSTCSRTSSPSPRAAAALLSRGPAMVMSPSGAQRNLPSYGQQWALSRQPLSHSPPGHHIPIADGLRPCERPATSLRAPLHLSIPESHVSSPTSASTPPYPHLTEPPSFFDEQFEPMKILGRGASGVVLLVRHRLTRLLYAVKVIVVTNKFEREEVLREVQLHASLCSHHGMGLVDVDANGDALDPSLSGERLIFSHVSTGTFGGFSATEARDRSRRRNEHAMAGVVSGSAEGIARYYNCWSEVASSKRAYQLAVIGVRNENGSGQLIPSGSAAAGAMLGCAALGSGASLPAMVAELVRRLRRPSFGPACASQEPERGLSCLPSPGSATDQLLLFLRSLPTTVVRQLPSDTLIHLFAAAAAAAQEPTDHGYVGGGSLERRSVCDAHKRGQRRRQGETHVALASATSAVDTCDDAVHGDHDCEDDLGSEVYRSDPAEDAEVMAQHQWPQPQCLDMGVARGVVPGAEYVTWGQLNLQQALREEKIVNQRLLVGEDSMDDSAGSSDGVKTKSKTLSATAASHSTGDKGCRRRFSHGRRTGKGPRGSGELISRRRGCWRTPSDAPSADCTSPTFANLSGTEVSTECPSSPTGHSDSTSSTFLAAESGQRRVRGKESFMHHSSSSSSGSRSTSCGSGSSNGAETKNSGRSVERYYHSLIGTQVMFIQMDYYHTTLAHELAQRTCVDRVWNLVVSLKLLSAIAFLHRHGIVHRDIKPSNILMDYRCQLDPTVLMPWAEDTSESSTDDDVSADGCDDGCGSDEENDAAGVCVNSPDGDAKLRQGSGPSGPPSPIDSPGGPSSAPKVVLPGCCSSTFNRDGCSLMYSNPHLFSPTTRHFLCPPRVMERVLQRMFFQLCLADFGLAKSLARQRVDVSSYFSRSSVNTVGVGSPLYSSPEQLEGRLLTPASDLFSAAIVIAELYLQPTTVSERIVTLTRVRESGFAATGNKDNTTGALSRATYFDQTATQMLQDYPELRVIRRMVHPDPQQRISLCEVQRAFRSALRRVVRQEWLRASKA